MIVGWPGLRGDSVGPKKQSLVEAFKALPEARGVSHIWNNQQKDNGPQGCLKSSLKPSPR